MSTSIDSGMASAGHSTSIVWVTMLTVPPRLTPGDWSALSTWTGMLTRITAPSAEPQEVDMHRRSLHRIELEVARDHAVLGAVDVEVVERGEEAPGIDALPQLGMIERDRQRGLVVAVDHARHAAGATRCPGGPLAALRTRRRLQFLDGRHVEILI